ncbi:hypothetical protein [Paracidovorax avenae]|uniref:hypothetical protein n=1 Tax=Paracidovorax avenae TaxID=80867 RepID=UPI0018646E10|nr:hypothetical protein [Paracidovorax avenae]
MDYERELGRLSPEKRERYLHDTILDLAERLLATVPGTDLAHLMLTCTGSEANDPSSQSGEHVIVFSEITLCNHCSHDFRGFEKAVAGY